MFGFKKKPEPALPVHKPRTKFMRVYEKLKADGKVTNSELNRICFRYGDIIFKLRQEGHDISTVRENASGLCSYIYRGKKKL